MNERTSRAWFWVAVAEAIAIMALIGFLCRNQAREPVVIVKPVPHDTKAEHPAVPEPPPVKGDGTPKFLVKLLDCVEKSRDAADAKTLEDVKVQACRIAAQDVDDDAIMILGRFNRAVNDLLQQMNENNVKQKGGDFINVVLHTECTEDESELNAYEAIMKTIEQGGKFEVNAYPAVKTAKLEAFWKSTDQDRKSKTKDLRSKVQTSMSQQLTTKGVGASPQAIDVIVRCRMEIQKCREDITKMLLKFNVPPFEVLYADGIAKYGLRLWEPAMESFKKAWDHYEETCAEQQLPGAYLADCYWRIHKFKEALEVCDKIHEVNKDKCPAEIITLSGRALLGLDNVNNVNAARARFAEPKQAGKFPSSEPIRTALLGMPLQSWRLESAALDVWDGKESEACDTIREALFKEEYSRRILDAVRANPVLMKSSTVVDLVTLKLSGWIRKGGWLQRDDLYVKNCSSFNVHNVNTWFKAYDKDGKEVGWAQSKGEAPDLKQINWLTNDSSGCKNSACVGVKSLVTDKVKRGAGQIFPKLEIFLHLRFFLLLGYM